MTMTIFLENTVPPMPPFHKDSGTGIAVTQRQCLCDWPSTNHSPPRGDPLAAVVTTLAGLAEYGNADRAGRARASSFQRNHRASLRAVRVLRRVTTVAEARAHLVSFPASGGRPLGGRDGPRARAARPSPPIDPRRIAYWLVDPSNFKSPSDTFASRSPRSMISIDRAVVADKSPSASSWQKDGSSITGATQSTLAFPNVQASDTATS